MKNIQEKILKATNEVWFGLWLGMILFQILCIAGCLNQAIAKADVKAAILGGAFCIFTTILTIVCWRSLPE